MNLSRIRATAGLSAVAAATQPAVDWQETIGTPSRSITIDAATADVAYELKAFLRSQGDVLTVEIDTDTPSSVTGDAATASGTLTLAGNASAGNTVTIGSRVYTFRAALSVPAVANEVLIGDTASDTIDNLVAAINGDAGAGTTYSTGTTAHADVNAQPDTGDTMHVDANADGDAGNSIATTETLSNGSWGATTLTGGLDASTLIGGAGTDFEGIDMPEIDGLAGIEIFCVAGSATVQFGSTALPFVLGPGGILLFATPTGGASFIDEVMTVTAGSDNTTVTVTVIGKANS